MTAFLATRIEGGLLAPDVLEQLLAADLPGQRAGDFGLDARRNLTDEIAAAFADARALWGVFQNRLARLPETDLATTATRDLWMIPFFDLLGYELKFNPRAHEVDGATFAISHRAGEAEDAPPVHIVGARQELGRVPPSGRPRLSPHALLQEYLNRTEHVWGLVTNGGTLRLLRDSTLVRRQAYVEFDLTEIFDEQRFQDFAVVYRLIHRSRLPRGIADVETALVEQYCQRSIEQGGRVREHLRDGVEACIQRLANGFLRASPELREAVSAPAGERTRLSADDLYRELLRLVYRLLFLLVSEDRGLLSSKVVYREHYGVARLRRLLDSRAAYTEHDDLWQSLRVLWKLLTDEHLAQFLEVAPLNGDLFAPLVLDTCTITNRNFLEAFWPLAWYRESPSSQPRRVNYAALDVEELGSVYESLLEFHPAIERDAARRPEFRLILGSERKTTGSYYTPPPLVNELVVSALEPVLRERLAANPADGEKALLSIRVCDPACGSGHFLLAAARRIGKELARVRSGEEEPAPERVREATRDVIAHCIYGVDRNPLAVDLCRVALWLESHTGGKPVTFLNHRIRPGDSLVGVFDLAALKAGIPDEAFGALEGDDKSVARQAARHNRAERDGLRDMFGWNPETVLITLSRTGREVDGIGDDTPEAVREKKRRFDAAHANPEWLKQKTACDLWTAAFFQRLTPKAFVITTAALADHLARRSVDPRLPALSWVIAEREKVFHWPLEFPEVFAGGGFDVILSNPPWEHVELKEQEFFSARDARIALAPTKAARTRLIGELRSEKPELYSEFIEHVRSFDAARSFMAHSGRYPLTRRGRINTYAVFAELARSALKANGRAGIIVPSGIATDDTTKFFFQDLVRSGSLASLYDFENRRGIFPAVHKSYKFCLLTMWKQSKAEATSARFVFFALATDDLRRPEKRFSLTAEEIQLLNPNTGNCPIFRTQADAELTKAIYRRVSVLWREARGGEPEQNPWRLRFSQGLFNMASDSHHFRTAAELEADGYRREDNVFVSRVDRYLPLYEAKMLHQFDHRWATHDSVDGVRDVTDDEKRDSRFVVQPRYWVRGEVVESAIPKYPEPLAVALRLDHRESIRRVLALWAAGHALARGDQAQAGRIFADAASWRLEREVAKAFGDDREREQALALARDFPLDGPMLRRIEAEGDAPERVASELVERFSPKWFVGFRRVCRTTDERSSIFSALPRSAVGDSEFLAIFAWVSSPLQLAFLAVANSMCFDYVARQKIGGMNLNFFIVKQLPVVGTTLVGNTASRDAGEMPFPGALVPEILELVFSAHDLAPLARDCSYDGPPFLWNPERRFEIRCELDAAFFHLYLPATAGGDWCPARVADGQVVDETPQQLAALKAHFPTPRDAVAYILDQFPIVRQKDEAAQGRYRTKDRILAVYDAMQAAQASGQLYRSALNPPPGTR